MKMVVTVDQFGGYSRNGNIPWDIKEDRLNFKVITTGSACVMGRRTYDHVLKRKIELKQKIARQILVDRECYVLSKHTITYAGALWVPSLEVVKLIHPDKQIFIVGGGRLFNDHIKDCSDVYMTVIRGSFNCDDFFPVMSTKDFHVKSERKITTESGHDLEFLHFSRS